MTDLIARLEAATEGSRDLSDDVLLSCGWVNENGWWRKPREQAVWLLDPTRSFDDAVAIMPPWWAIELVWDLVSPSTGKSGKWGASVFIRDCEHDHQHPRCPRASCHDASTIPLAFCIAIVKAQEQLDPASANCRPPDFGSGNPGSSPGAGTKP